MQKVLTGLIVIVLVVGLAALGWLLLSRQHGRALDAVAVEGVAAVEGQRVAAAQIARELAMDATRGIALAIAEPVARADFSAVETTLAKAVQGHRFAGFQVLSLDGEVLATTDLRFRGRTLDDPAARRALTAMEPAVAPDCPQPGQIEVHLALTAGQEHVGVLRAFVEIGDLAAD